MFTLAAKKQLNVFRGTYFFDNHKYNIITFRYKIPGQNESQSKFGKTYKVGCVKPKNILLGYEP